MDDFLSSYNSFENADNQSNQNCYNNKASINEESITNKNNNIDNSNDNYNSNNNLNFINQNNNNVTITSLNNEDSVLKDAFDSLNKVNISKNEKSTNIFNNNQFDENVNLGISFSKISEDELKTLKKCNTDLKNILNIEELNNQIGIITPNTSIYNFTQPLNKNDIYINTKNSNINKKANFFDDCMMSPSKDNIKIKNKYNYEKDENNKLINEILNDNINKKENTEILSIKTSQKNNSIISKRFNELKRKKNLEKKNIVNIMSNSNINSNESINKKDNIINNEEKININNKIDKDNKYIYLCPYCSKDVPNIIKLEGIQNDISEKTNDIISINCKCGNYKLNLFDYILLLEKEQSYQHINENCYNTSHGQIKANSYCPKCDKFFCENCLLYHKSLLSDHMISPTKISFYSKCNIHNDSDILYYCNDCNLGICKNCKINSHNDHYISDINYYFNKTFMELPFKTFNELDEYINYCNKLSEKAKNTYIKFIDDMINKLNEIKKNILDNFEISFKRRINQQKLIKYLFGNFICFNENYQQIKNMNSINIICPSLFLYNGKDFIKGATEFSLYLKKESFIEINNDKKIDKNELYNIFNKYNKILNLNKINNSSYKNNLTTKSSESKRSNIIENYPFIFKIYDGNSIYYGEINENKKNGIGKLFNEIGEYEGIWIDGNIIKGKSIYYSDQGNIIYEGEFKNGMENGYGEKIYPNNRIYKGIFVNGKIDIKYEIQKKLELAESNSLIYKK